MANNIIGFLSKTIDLNQIERLLMPDYADSINGYNIGISDRKTRKETSTLNKTLFKKDRKNIFFFDGVLYNSNGIKQKTLPKNFKKHEEFAMDSYQEQDISAFELFEGDFAFVLIDKKKQKLFLVRDFFGKKPLYYQKDIKGNLKWASQLKDLAKILDKKPKISKAGLNLFMQLTYIPAPYTIYEDVYKLEADHYLEYDLNAGSVSINKIHRKNKRVLNKNISFDKAKTEVNQLVRESVISRSKTSLKTGTFLSGGVDSSIVSLCHAQNKESPIDTFSLGFKKKAYNETDKAKTVAQIINSRHHEFIIGQDDLLIDLDEILSAYDEPFADSSALPSYFIAQKAKEKVDMVLTGDGGDEVFGGYNKYQMGNINKHYTAVIPPFLHTALLKVANPLTRQKEDNRGFKFKVRKTLHAIDYNDEFFYNIIKLGFTKSDISQYLLPEMQDKTSFDFYKNNITAPKNLTDYRNVDKMMSLEGGMIVKVERLSRITGLENRSPFLNKKLWDYTLNLPEKYLMPRNDQKHILKKAFEQEFPKGFLDNPKKGFNVPVGDWLRQGEMRDELRSYVEDTYLKEQNIFKSQPIQRLIKNHINAIEDNTYKVWTFYCFQKWYNLIYQKLGG